MVASEGVIYESHSRKEKEMNKSCRNRRDKVLQVRGRGLVQKLILRQQNNLGKKKQTKPNMKSKRGRRLTKKKDVTQVVKGEL